MTCSLYVVDTDPTPHNEEDLAVSRLEKLFAKRCDKCPLCIYARKNPETLFGKFMHWHGTWCPFWKAWHKEYGNNPPDQKVK
jgi:hypothetical protein